MLKNDLQYRAHLATLIIFILMDSTVAALFQGCGEARKSQCLPLLMNSLSARMLNVSKIHTGNRGDGCSGVCCIHIYEQKNTTTNIKIPLRIVCCFQFGVVLAQSFTKGKGQRHLLLVYCESIKAAHFILQNSHVPNGCIFRFDEI